MAPPWTLLPPVLLLLIPSLSARQNCASFMNLSLSTPTPPLPVPPNPGGNAFFARHYQSDRLVDLLLPVDSVVGLLAQAVDGVDGTNGDNPIGASYPQIEGLPVAAAYDGAGEVDAEASPMERMEKFPANVPQGAAGTMCVKSPVPAPYAIMLLSLAVPVLCGGGFSDPGWYGMCCLPHDRSHQLRFRSLFCLPHNNLNRSNIMFFPRLSITIIGGV